VDLGAEFSFLARVVRHDLREPIRAMQGFSRVVAADYADVLDDRALDRLRRVADAGARLDQLVCQLAAYLEARILEPRLESIDGSELVDNVARDLRELCEQRSARLDVAPDLPRLRVDREWATRALSNLVQNAIVFGAKEAPRVVVSALDDGPGLRIGDDGEGFAADPETLFPLFRRGVGREGPGVGAGLTIARAVARSHGGDVWVQSSGSAGSVLAISFAEPEGRDR
jgi:signal transduction histidine kinase